MPVISSIIAATTGIGLAGAGAIGTGIAGGLVGATASVYQGVEANKAAKREARQIAFQRDVQIKQEREGARRRQGQLAAAVGVSGVEAAGSPLLVGLRNAFDSLEQQAAIRTGANMAIGAARARGRAGLTAGILGGVGGTLQTASRAGSLLFDA